MGSLRGLATGIVSIVCIGCATTPDPICALIGGMAGAFAGGVVAREIEEEGDSNSSSVAIGIGSAAVGAGIGYWICSPRKKKPEPRLAQAPVVEPVPEPTPPPPPPPPVIDPCEGPVRLEGVNFDLDEAAIRPDASMVLDGVAAKLRDCSKVQVRIEAHTDATASDAYNQELSLRRADSVLQYLLEAGVDPARMSTLGFGESQPIAPNDTPEGRAKNRRVELKLVE